MMETGGIGGEGVPCKYRDVSGKIKEVGGIRGGGV